MEHALACPRSPTRLATAATLAATATCRRSMRSLLPPCRPPLSLPLHGLLAIAWLTFATLAASACPTLSLCHFTHPPCACCSHCLVRCWCRRLILVVCTLHCHRMVALARSPCCCCLACDPLRKRRHRDGERKARQPRQPCHNGSQKPRRRESTQEGHNKRRPLTLILSLSKNGYQQPS